jgi:endonuclease-3
VSGDPAFPIDEAVRILAHEMPNLPQPLIDGMARDRTPFRVLIATILSLRTKDTLTATITPQLFAAADTPAAMLALGEEQIAQLIYPVGFYRNKARDIVRICQILIDRYQGEVPHTLDELLALPGVGRKTANLVLTAGFGLPGICVDIHVHRICNRWGYVATKLPDATELVLREILPHQYWIGFNALLVTLGQNICHPTSPRCSNCPVAHLCARIGVIRSR